MKSASHLHSKTADRVSWSLIFFWSQYWTNNKNKAHDDDYDSLVKILFTMVWDVLYLLRLCSNAMIYENKVWRDRSNRLVYKYNWKHSVSQHEFTFILSVLTLQFCSDMAFTSSIMYNITPIKEVVDDLEYWRRRNRTLCTAIVNVSYRFSI